MSKAASKTPVALTIAGSDPSGGAGLQADGATVASEQPQVKALLV